MASTRREGRGTEMTRREVLRRFLALGLALPGGAALLAACGGREQPAATTGAQPQPTVGQAGQTPTAAGQAEDKLEIFSWWTNPGEADGLQALFDIFKQRKPGVEIINATVAGGAGTNAKAVLVTRMQGGNPPDSFQVHAGQELIGTWVVAGKMEPINDLFEQEGWNKVMPKTLLDQISYKGEFYSVPVNIHRSNMLWYNKQVFEANNLEPPKTLDDFYQVAEKLKAAGVTPLSVGGKDKFEVPHLFEDLLLAVFGPKDYAALFTDPGMWENDERIDQAIETLDRFLSYANEDRSALSWADAAQRIIDGSAAMTIMGDWAYGYFINKGAKPGQVFGWAPSPGTDGSFLWLSDSFGLPKGAPHRTNAIEWLKVCGSREGQDAFNPKKGSIPARTDPDKSKYDEYLQYSIERFAQDALAPSVVHGAAANEAYMTDYGNALNVFSASRDKNQLKAMLIEAAGELKGTAQ